MMMDMPPMQFALVNKVKMGFYAAGMRSERPALVLCHGWPELAYSWRHQIKALSDAGFHVLAPDQRGYGQTQGPTEVEAYDLDHLTCDLEGLLDHCGIKKAIFVGHDWGGFVVWAMAMRYPSRVAGVVGVNTPHIARPPADPIALFKERFGSSMYIVQFQDPTDAVAQIFDTRVEQTFDFFMRKPVKYPKPSQPGVICPNHQKSNLPLAFPQYIAAYDAAKDPRAPLLSAEEKKVYVDTFKKTGFTGGINWYRNFSRNWERDAALDHTIRVPCLMVMAELDHVLPPASADGMEALIPDLEKHLIENCGHWTQHEKPEALNAVLIDWLGRRFS